MVSLPTLAGAVRRAATDLRVISWIGIGCLLVAAGSSVARAHYWLGAQQVVCALLMYHALLMYELAQKWRQRYYEVRDNANRLCDVLDRVLDRARQASADQERA